MAPTSKEKNRIDLPEIQKLIRMIEKSPITQFELEDKDLRIKISKNGNEPAVVQTMMPQPAPAPAAAPVAAPAAGAPSEPAVAAPGKNIVEIKAPMVGTFYSAPSPDADPYVSVGERVSDSQVLCIIEAMKLMNEVEADVSGKLIEICVNNADPVEFNQVLFRVDTGA